MQLFKSIDPGKMKDLQIRQYFNALVVRAVVPKLSNGGTTTAKININNAGDFLCNDVTGKYSTLIDDGAVKDDGTNHLTVRISDSKNVELFDDFIPLDLFLSPGRVRTMGILVDAAGGVPNPSQQLFLPKSFQYIFAANNDIILEFKNDSTADNTVWIAFWGTRIKNFLSVKGISERADTGLNQ